MAHSLDEDAQYETRMIAALMDEAVNQGAFPGVEIFTVHAPLPPGTRRATTKDALLAWRDEYGIHDILLISHQPYVEYQLAVALQTLSSEYNIDAAGPGDVIGTLSDGLDTLARTVYASKDRFIG